jgi:hypothetical protein
MNVRELPQGRMIIGKFGGCRQKIRRSDGTPIRNMFEFELIEDKGDREWTHHLSFFDTDRDGDVTKVREMFNELQPPLGALVAVKFGTDGTISKDRDRAYTNDTATAIYLLDGR